MKDSELERRFLDFVYTTEAPITVGAVAYHAGCSLAEAEAYLDQLAGAGRIRIENDDDGNLFYVYPDRGKPSAGALGEGGASRACPLCGEPIRQVAKKCRHCGEYLTPELRAGQRALVRAVDLRPTDVRPVLNPGTAAVLSLLFPGAGQIYAGRLGAGIAWMFAVALSYPLFIVPGVILHFFCVASAARMTRDANERRR